MERKLVTVLFADAIGSTSLADQFDPERLRTVLDAYFDEMAAAVAAWGGTVEKFIGDAVMAVFGVPAVREDDAVRALSAAMEMMERLTRLNSDLQQQHGVTLRMRVGVNSGEVVAGPASGESQRIVSGEPVNVAARLQAEAEPDSILVGERTYLAARHAFGFSEPTELSLKGKPDLVKARRVLRRLPEPTRGIPGLSSPLVGRIAELQSLTSLLDEVRETRRPRLVTVLGPAGVGKSRLVREFVDAVRESHRDVRVLRGRCLAAGHGITYWALGEILREACGIQLDDTAAVAAEKLRTVTTDRRTAEALAATAGIQVPGGRLRDITPQAVADELAWAWPRFATAQAQNLAVWVIEDLHWAGAPLLEMLEKVIARSTGALLVIGTSRPDLVESHPDFGGGSEDFSTISLRPLSARHSEDLLRGLLSIAELPEGFVSEILARAEGNPFFLEEIVRRLIEEGALEESGGRWRATGVKPSAPLPDSLLGLLSARIDSLSEQDKRVLQEAAVVGKVFWAEPLQRALQSDVTPSLLALERRGLISARTTSSIAAGTEYVFRHALVRDVAYSSLPKARRARAHAEVGAWIVELAGERSDEFGELIAYHYMSAVAGPDADLAWNADEREPVRRKAFASLVAAGEQARRRFAIAKSIELHEQALSVADRNEAEFEALEQLGDDHASAYHGDDAQQKYVAALDIARRAGLPDRARLCAKLADMMADIPGAFKRSPEPGPVEALIAEGLAHAADDVTTARLNIAFGQVARLYSENERVHVPDPVPLPERIMAAENARAAAVRLDDLGLQWSADSALDLLYAMAERYQDCLDLGMQSLRQIDRLPRSLQGDVLRRVADVSMTIGGKYKDGLEFARRSLELLRDTSPHQLMHATFPIMEALYELGRSDEIPPVLEQHVAAFRLDPALECDYVRDGPVLGAFLAARAGDRSRALELAGLLGDSKSDTERGTAWEARLAVALGDADEARRISSGKAVHGRPYGPDHARSMLEALVAQRDWDELERFLPVAWSLVAGLAILGPCCDRAEALLAGARGGSAAAAGLDRAIEGFTALGAAAELAATREMVARVG